MEENKAKYSSAIYVSRGRMGRVGKISQSYGREKGTINHNRHHAEFAWDFWLQDGGLPTTTPLQRSMASSFRRAVRVWATHTRISFQD
jgi:hypothetical protein